jgi:hypothetical protein
MDHYQKAYRTALFHTDHSRAAYFTVAIRLELQCSSIPPRPSTPLGTALRPIVIDSEFGLAPPRPFVRAAPDCISTIRYIVMAPHRWANGGGFARIRAIRVPQVPNSPRPSNETPLGRVGSLVARRLHLSKGETGNVPCVHIWTWGLPKMAQGHWPKVHVAK